MLLHLLNKPDKPTYLLVANTLHSIIIVVEINSVLQTVKGLGSRRGEIGPAIEMHTDLKYVYMVYFIEKNRNFICLVLKL